MEKQNLQSIVSEIAKNIENDIETSDFYGDLLEINDFVNAYNLFRKNKGDDVLVVDIWDNKELSHLMAKNPTLNVRKLHGAYEKLLHSKGELSTFFYASQAIEEDEIFLIEKKMLVYMLCEDLYFLVCDMFSKPYEKAYKKLYKHYISPYFEKIKEY